MWSLWMIARNLSVIARNLWEMMPDLMILPLILSVIARNLSVIAHVL